MSTILEQPGTAIELRDTYRFGNGPQPVLRPGTHGWTADDFEDPVLRGLWDQGRYEIIDGLLTVLPAAFFGCGSCRDELNAICKTYLKAHNVNAVSSAGVDVQVRDDLLIRADGVVIFGDDVPKFKALKFANGRSWARNNLIIPPTLVIESVSHGHELYDRRTKRAWYAEFGVPHYWIVDSLTRQLDCLALSGRQYVDDGHGGDVETVTVKSLDGLVIPLADIWAD
jgi:hypothetical protein